MRREEFVARMLHVGWVCYQIGVGEDYNEQPTQEQLEMIINGISFVLENPGATPEQIHDDWMKSKSDQGYIYGSKKDEDKKTHPDMVPFCDLSITEQRKDIMTSTVIRLGLELWELTD